LVPHPGIKKLILQLVQGNQLCCESLAVAGSNDRSLAIQRLLAKRDESHVKVCYIYLDYQGHADVTTEGISKNLLKQILAQCDVWPAEVESLYASSVHESGTPKFDTVMRLLREARERFVIYAIFDALDECTETGQRDIISLLNILHDSSFKLLVSSRPHVSFPDEFLRKIQKFHIRAHDSDLENYVKERLGLVRKASPQLEAGYMELVKSVDGM
jgi:hypothetical protein